MTTPDSHELAREARASALRMVHAARASHIGSSFSMMDILAVLYSGSANIHPEAVQDPDRDMVVVSKGHAAAGTYAILAHAGFFPIENLESFCRDDSMMMGHVTAGGAPGVELSTGSLGHGLGFGVGVSLADRADHRERRVFVVMSDGECDEGSVWEAALIAAHHQLENLTVIIDRNRLQSFQSTETTLGLEPLDEKWAAFGWRVRTVDGHDHDELRTAFAERAEGAPSVVIARTTKGFGVPFMEGKVEWHYRPPSDEELEDALSQLGGPRA